MGNKIFGYDFFEGDKGVVFAVDIEQANKKVTCTYGKEYCLTHKLKVKEADMWDVDVYCIIDTWN